MSTGSTETDTGKIWGELGEVQTTVAGLEAKIENLQDSVNRILRMLSTGGTNWQTIAIWLMVAGAVIGWIEYQNRQHVETMIQNNREIYDIRLQTERERSDLKNEVLRYQLLARSGPAEKAAP